MPPRTAASNHQLSACKSQAGQEIRAPGRKAKAVGQSRTRRRSRLPGRSLAQRRVNRLAEGRQATGYAAGKMHPQRSSPARL
jgi:hypothetical protein